METITKSLDVSAVASATSVSFEQQNQSPSAILRPEMVVCIGQAQSGVSVQKNKLYLSSGNPDDIGVMFGFGSPLHRMALKLFPKSGNGSKVDTYFLPIEEPKAESAKASVQTLTPVVSGGTLKKTLTGYFRLKDLIFEAAADVAGKVATNAHNNPPKAPRGTDLNSYEYKDYPFALTKGMTVSEIAVSIKEALEENLELPFTIELLQPEELTTGLTLSAKWKGSDSFFEFELLNKDKEAFSDLSDGLTFNVESTVDSSGEGSISDEALDLLTTELGVTRVISQYATSTVLDKLQEYFEGWHEGLIAQFVLCYSAIKAPESELVPGTWDLETLIKSGNDRKDDSVNVQIVGDFGELRPLKYKERDRLLKAGFSNLVRKADDSYTLMDLVTFYHPTGNSNPIYRFDRDVTCLGSIAYDLNQTFRDSDEWKSVIFASINDVTTNPDVRTLKDIKAACNRRIGLLGQQGIIADYSNAQKNTIIKIDDKNPNRININLKFYLTSVGRIFDLVNFVGFYFGE